MRLLLAEDEADLAEALGVFFEKNHYKENTFVSFSLKWLTDGKDKFKKPCKKRKSTKK